ncbi:MAG: type II toxin-antitoxin system RelE/ParE family toxin [Nitrospirae bacterium]|nr:type II toxin-antitoxin system RelE/ParE family toxin [Nitrospirota bacterium]MBF0592140.1 type II toxin-antitoxin system RelE/ParE family toxin [Nitrospirota bacterium]
MIKWSELAYRKLRHVETKQAVEILNSVNRIYEDPYKYGKPLKGKHKGEYSLRVGDFRVIYTIEVNEVSIISIGHRKDIYK